MLILDEAVAAVDPGTEDQIQQALAHLVAGRTVIVIAHRLSTVTSADRIVVVRDGRVAGSGRHTELLEGCDAYRELVSAQEVTR